MLVGSAIDFAGFAVDSRATLAHVSDSQDAAETEPKNSTTPRRQSPVDYFEQLRSDIEFVGTWETICAYNYPGMPPPEPEWPMIGHFEAREWVGHGGYGAVVIGRDTRLDRLVALKLCPATLDPKAERRPRAARRSAAVGGFGSVGVLCLAVAVAVPPVPVRGRRRDQLARLDLARAQASEDPAWAAR